MRYPSNVNTSKVIEAMAMAKPIIATNIRGCREEVFHNENGYLVQKGNSLALYVSMKMLLENESLRTQFGKVSRRFVEDYFNENDVIDKQLQLFDKK